MKNKINLNNALKDCLQIAEAVGKKLLNYQKKLDSLTITSKERQGVASTADIEAEKYIIKNLLARYPKTDVLAEESAFDKWGGKSGAYKHYKNEEWTWVIDPLDGTHNFLAGLDYFAVCISLVHYGVPVLGVVYRPANGDCFYALKDKGAKFQNKKVGPRARKLYSKSSTKKLHETMLVTGFATEKGEVFDNEFRLFKKMMEKGRGIRRMGSAALDLCYVAGGPFDGFWERGLAPWDISAAGLICLEAGVIVTDYAGNPFCPFDQTILAARNPLMRTLKKEFSGQRP